MKKLYKRDNNGGTRIWHAEINGRSYRLHSGALGGKVVTSAWTTCDGKNIGRANETTPDQQAQAEVESLYTRKLKRGYTSELDGIDKAKDTLISPMLAHKYFELSPDLFPVYAQPKLDGIRCIINTKGVWSRKGEMITTIPHIALILQPIAEKHDIQFDGELYNHDLKDNFNKIASLVRRQNIDDKHARDIRDLIQYHIYDIIQNDEPARFSARYDYLGELFNEYNLRDGTIKRVYTTKSINQEQLDEYYGLCLEDGYEGQIVRLDKPYERKRTNSLLKRKEFQDEEFTIVDIIQGKGNRAGMVGAITFETTDGKSFQASLMGTNDYRTLVWGARKSYVGLQATVKYFHKTPDGIPRFPVVKTIHEKI